MAIDHSLSLGASLFKLPPEILQMIYNMVVLESPTRDVLLSRIYDRRHKKQHSIPFGGNHQLSLSWTGACRQFAQEVDKRVFYRRNHFIAGDIPTLRAFMADTPSMYLAAIEHLSIGWFEVSIPSYNPGKHSRGIPKKTDLNRLLPVMGPNINPQPEMLRLLKPFKTLRTIRFTSVKPYQRRDLSCAPVPGVHPSKQILSDLAAKCVQISENLQTIIVESSVDTASFDVMWMTRIELDDIPTWSYSIPRTCYSMPPHFDVLEMLQRIHRPHFAEPLQQSE